MDMLVIYGLIGGLVSTVVMTLTEIPSWRKWHLYGVFEWHENQVITRKLFSISNDEKETTHIKGIFLFHFLNGTLVGIAFPFIIISLFPSFINDIESLLLLGILYGFIVWIVTLIPIHKPITGLSPWNHPLGKWPVVASLEGHIVYGFILGLIIFALFNIF
jgi:fructose-specific phosphotransferase system IIC component